MSPGSPFPEPDGRRSKGAALIESGVPHARYCVGDVGGERRRFRAGIRQVQPGRTQIPLTSKKLASLDVWHPDGLYVNSAGDPDPGIHRGIEAVRQQIWRWVESYPDLQLEPLEIQTNGNRAFVWVRFSGHAAASGVPIDLELGSRHHASGREAPPYRGILGPRRCPQSRRAVGVGHLAGERREDRRPVLLLVVLILFGVAVIAVVSVALLRPSRATEARRVEDLDSERDVYEKLYGRRSKTVSAPEPVNDRQKRRPVGVGDVGGERGGSSTRLRGV